MRIGFEYPLLIIAGLFIFILILFLSRFFKRGVFLSVPLGPPGGASFKPPVSVEWLVRLLAFLDYAAFFGFALAAAGPEIIYIERVWLSRGADILFVMDISPSMAALDMDGHSRFDTARELIRDFAENRPADAIGLAALATDAALLVPPTVDRRALLSRLDSLSIGELGDETALGTGLALGALHISSSRSPRKAVVLITDGESNAGSVHPETAARALASGGASLWVIGVGSSGMVRIDYVDSETRVRRTGAFESRFDAESLKAIARAGNGVYIDAPKKDAFIAAFSRIDEGEMVIRRSGTLRHSLPLYRPVIAASLAMLILSRLVRRYLLGDTA